MKRIIAIVFALFLALGLNAQKFAYVDSQYILDNIPDYKSAQAQLDKYSLQWQKEIQAKFDELDKLYKDFQADAILLTEEMRKKREDEILDKEKQAKELQKNRFGKDGDLFKKRQELVKPIQDKVYNALKDFATTKNYAVIFDKSSDLTILYANPKYDISDEILDEMGFKNTSSDDSGSGSGGGTGGGTTGGDKK
ncbi:MAG: OmpH family outer membrane protein [Sphingobacteriales bacterium JAD_PAG50586_3]|nr:MAG: OmpH family outer membrane protein [Sphingobacteriales bacterium JAD_PAG50586_3]